MTAPNAQKLNTKTCSIYVVKHIGNYCSNLNRPLIFFWVYDTLGNPNELQLVPISISELSQFFENHTDSMLRILKWISQLSKWDLIENANCNLV